MPVARLDDPGRAPAEGLADLLPVHQVRRLEDSKAAPRGVGVVVGGAVAKRAGIGEVRVEDGVLVGDGWGRHRSRGLAFGCCRALACLGVLAALGAGGPGDRVVTGGGLLAVGDVGDPSDPRLSGGCQGPQHHHDCTDEQHGQSADPAVGAPALHQSMYLGTGRSIAASGSSTEVAGRPPPARLGEVGRAVVRDSYRVTQSVRAPTSGAQPRPTPAGTPAPQSMQIDPGRPKRAARSSRLPGGWSGRRDELLQPLPARLSRSWPHSGRGWVRTSDLSRVRRNAVLAGFRSIRQAQGGSTKRSSHLPRWPSWRTFSTPSLPAHGRSLWSWTLPS